MVKIPVNIETYPENSIKPQEVHSKETHEYTDGQGNKVLVHSWVRWPEYDFMFGTPHPKSVKYEKEYAFFQFRKLEKGKDVFGWYIYLDQLELEEVIAGFNRLLEISKETRKEDWEKLEQNRPKMEVKKQE